MRIGFLTPEYVTEPYFSGGLANFLHRTSVALARRGHDVHVFTWSELDSGDFVADGVSVHRIAPSGVRRWLRTVSRARLQESADWIDLTIAACRRVRRAHRQAPFDLLQLPNYSACGLLSSIFRHPPSVVRLSTYGPDWNECAGIAPSLDRRVTEWLEALQLRIARHVYAPTAFLQRVASDKAGLRGVEVIPTPFYLEPVRTDMSVYDEHFRGRQYLLFFGRLQPHKGVHVLARALPAVLTAHPEATAAFVGMDLPSCLAPSMRAHITALCAGFEDRLLFVDALPHDQLYPVVDGARLVVLPSLIDNLPNAGLEAMALGRPVVATHGTSFEEMMEDGVTGFLVPPGDASALAEALVRIWCRTDLAAIGGAARDRVRRFHPDVTITRLEAYYRAIADHGR
jgi:glycosyltransferase involved in cell wall biosynthesis